MLAGLIRDEERRVVDGIPGLSDLPVVGRIFAHTRTEINQTDIILTLTPHIIRVLDVDEADLRAFRVGRDSVSSLGAIRRRRSTFRRRHRRSAGSCAAPQPPRQSPGPRRSFRARPGTPARRHHPTLRSGPPAAGIHAVPITGPAEAGRYAVRYYAASTRRRRAPCSRSTSCA